MTKHLILFILANLLATPLAAQTPMGATEFEAYTRGKTLYFGYDSTPMGGEEYLPNRRVRWSVLDGQCKNGHWYPEGQMICFLYDGNPDPQCWSFHQTDAGLTARHENSPSQRPLSELQATVEPLYCLGPEIGVSFSPAPLDK